MSAQSNTMGTTSLKIEGMSCGHCVEAVGRILRGIEGLGVRSVVVGGAVVEAPEQARIRDVLEALDDGGYPARVASAIPATDAGPGCGCAGKATGGCG